MTTLNTTTRRSGLIIYGWLVFLTILEVGVVAFGISQPIGAIIMAGTTLSKVLMIALYFMHMKHESLKGWMLPVIPLVLALFFVAMLFPDLVFHLPLQFR